MQTPRRNGHYRPVDFTQTDHTKGQENERVSGTSATAVMTMPMEKVQTAFSNGSFPVFLPAMYSCPAKAKDATPCGRQGRAGRYPPSITAKKPKKKALALGSKYNITIDYSVTDLTTVSLPENHYDLIVLIFLHLPKTFRPAFHEKVIQAIRPGGHLLAELFFNRTIEVRHRRSSKKRKC